MAPARKPERGSHSSGTTLARCLLQPTRMTGPERAGPLARSTSSLFGLAPGGVCLATHVAMRAVGSYPTLSPLPAGSRRYPLCGTFPGVAPAGRYPAPFFRGARTFLPPQPFGPSGERLPGQLAGGA